jgi:hypothetical protein
VTKDYIAVTRDPRELKRLLFLFDRVGIMGLNDLMEIISNGGSIPGEEIEISAWEQSAWEQLHYELTELIEKRIIFEPFLAESRFTLEPGLQESVPSSDSQSDYEQELSKKLEGNGLRLGALVWMDWMLKRKKDGLLQSSSIPLDPASIKSKTDDAHNRIRELEIRLLAARMRGLGQEAYPIVEFSNYSNFAATTPKSTVIEGLLSGLPIPGDDIPFGRLLEFRDDAKSRRLLLALRRWIRNISNEKLSPVELADEIEWQICENREHMRLHKLRAKNTLWKIILKCPLDILENLIKIRLAKSIDAIFEVREIHVSLLAEELKAPGRELSYIARIREDFS